MKIMKKQTGILILWSIVSLLASCSNDDNGAREEPETPIVAPEGELVLTNTNTIRTRELTLNFANGEVIGDTTLDEPQNKFEHQGAFYIIKEDNISRQASSGVTAWEREYLETSIVKFPLLDANLALSTDVLFIQYARQDKITFERQYFLEALELSTGATRWIEELSFPVESIPFIVENRLLLTPRNSFYPIRYYNMQTGAVEAENSFEDRVDPGRFVTVNGNIIASSWNDRILALDDNLNIAWTFETNGTNAIKGILVNNQFIFPSRDENLYALDQNSGSLNWETPLPNRLTLGIHHYQDQIYLLQPSVDAPPQLLTIDSDNGTINSINPIETGATSTDDIQVSFFDEFMVTVSALGDSVSNLQLIHLPTAEIVWETTTDTIGFGSSININKQ